ncbi:protein TIFY 5A-like [Tasmannia lanceolata]|uniref:protein TIFY 5A-like n=1 Tax=Tasmannia lanceolata TaxID=3420 RepID=UPI00406321E3
MGKNLNLELCLLPAGAGAGDNANADHFPSRNEVSDENSQQLTIFYDGRICACNVTEIQARAILHLAKREMEERPRTCDSEPFLPSQQTQLNAPALSMKRSLQRFLQKRKTRIQETSPY